MPLTPYQKTLAKLLSVNRTQDSHLAGGAALHFAPNSIRYSADLDYFHDSVERVNTAYRADEALLKKEGHFVSLEIDLSGYRRAVVSKGDLATKVEWSHDSDWRFMPVIFRDDLGYLLHPVDIAINKTLALAGRNEPRDFIDVLHVHSTILPLGALCWAAVGKDPGFTPHSLLELLRRRGKFQEEDFRRLHLVEAADLKDLKQQWLQTLDEAEAFIKERPSQEIGCLYYSIKKENFFAPKQKENYHCHYGKPGGVLPAISD